jgi:predicted AlkP superfamily pyrophosphatase or phosphodiesterase
MSFRVFLPCAFAALFCYPLTAADAPHRAVAVISIDGMHPDNVLKADQFNLKIPNLRRYLRDGAHASSVRGVLPTVTYPSHTTMMTGVSPARHGIYANETWDPLHRNQGGWYWYAEDIHAPTLWQAASRAGYVVGSISWPVTAGAPGIAFNIPEYWRAQTPDDLKLLRLVSTPGLVADFEKNVGEYTVNLDDVEAGDWNRTRYAIAMIQRKGVRFLTLHLAAFDHVEHSDGPYSARAFAALEEIDKMVGQIEAAIRKADPRAALCVVSDHGFAAVDHQLNLNVALVKAGLLQLNAGGTAIQDWKAQPWSSAGSAAVILKDPADAATRAKLEEVLRSVAADPANGIERVLDRNAIAALGGTPAAAFWVDMKSNYALGAALTGPLVREISRRGTHGFAPTHPDLQASFFVVAPGVRKGYDLGAIDMRSFAPTFARLLGIDFPGADLPPLPAFEGVK